jgi:hypothetical protein
MLKIYVGCSLTHAPQEFRDAVEGLKDALRADCTVLDFVGLEKGTAQDVYAWDIGHCIAECDLFVAVCDHPSLGLGYEMASAVESLKKPTLAIAHEDATIGRIILGISQPHYAFERYGSMRTDVPALIHAFAAKHFTS